MSNSEILEQNNKKLAELTETLSQKTLSQVPAGGTTDQILAKASDNDYDTKWVNAPSGGGEKWYQHNITASPGVTKKTISAIIINKTLDIITADTLLSFLKKYGALKNTSFYPAHGVSILTNNVLIHYGICYDDTDNILTVSTGVRFKTTTEGNYTTLDDSDYTSNIKPWFIDNVIEL